MHRQAPGTLAISTLASLKTYTINGNNDLVIGPTEEEGAGGVGLAADGVKNGIVPTAMTQIKNQQTFTDGLVSRPSVAPLAQQPKTANPVAREISDCTSWHDMSQESE